MFKQGVDEAPPRKKLMKLGNTDTFALSKKCRMEEDSFFVLAVSLVARACVRPKKRFHRAERESRVENGPFHQCGEKRGRLPNTRFFIARPRCSDGEQVPLNSLRSHDSALGPLWELNFARARLGRLVRCHHRQNVSLPPKTNSHLSLPYTQ